jgi:hypothetical protein
MFISIGFSATNQPIGPKIVIDEPWYDGKQIYEGNNIEHVFKVFNKGEEPLIIEKVETG